MASAVISKPVPQPASPPSDELRLVDLSWRAHLLRVALFSLPFLALALVTYRYGFLTNAHALVTAKALLAADRLRLEVIGFLYPPLPFLLVLVFPRPWLPSVLASIAAGATAWLVWYDLERVGLARLWRMLLLAAVVVIPSNVFLATQAYPDMLALHLIVMAWHYYINFVRHGHTFSGFVAGLILGLALYANFYALVYALALASLVPLFRRSEASTGQGGEWATLSQMLVTAFPALWAVASWTYINWVFTGNPMMYLTDPAAAVIDPERWGVPLAERWGWLAEFGRELIMQPLLLGVFAANLWRAPRRLVPLVVLAVVPSLLRFFGFAYPLPLVLATYTVLALIALPERLPRWVGPVIVALALGQGATTAVLLQHAGEVRQWQQVLVNGIPRASDQDERELGQRLRAAPPYSILADDRSAYRIIARAETARPFLLPADASFGAALAEPARSVGYILVTQEPLGRDLVSERFADGPPDGFVVDGQQGSWKLYRRIDQPSLLH
ncbi:hypothetical protein [Thermomicrobium sp.]|uniref:hypothetical protein n=1 Tax=Thermomicrobium sp. TaxID=1969469 RepID=UPI001B2B67AC|nr:hypothetical protein [Thermomicrobium sp.]MBO9306338.1 hypothetical protein [Thermomicrobium sp.]